MHHHCTTAGPVPGITVLAHSPVSNCSGKMWESCGVVFSMNWAARISYGFVFKPRIWKAGVCCGAVVLMGHVFTLVSSIARGNRRGTPTELNFFVFKSCSHSQSYGD